MTETFKRKWITRLCHIRYYGCKSSYRTYTYCLQCNKFWHGRRSEWVGEPVHFYAVQAMGLGGPPSRALAYFGPHAAVRDKTGLHVPRIGFWVSDKDAAWRCSWCTHWSNWQFRPHQYLKDVYRYEDV